MLPCYLTLWAICVGYVSSQTRIVTLDECTNQKEIRGHSFHMLFNGVMKQSINCTFLFPENGGVLLHITNVKIISQVNQSCSKFDMWFFNGPRMVKHIFTTCGWDIESSQKFYEKVNKVNISYDIAGITNVTGTDINVTLTGVSNVSLPGYRHICGYFMNESVLCDGVANCPCAEDERECPKPVPIWTVIMIILVVLFVGGIGSVVAWCWYHRREAVSGGLENQPSQEFISLINNGGNMGQPINDQNSPSASDVHGNVENHPVSIET